MKHSQRGYSLVELSIVLAIIAVVIAGAITGVQSILRANNVNRTITTTNKAVGSIISKYIRDSDYSGISMQNLTNGGMDIWEAKDITNAGAANAAVINAFGGSVFVAPMAAAWNGLAVNQAFVYTLTNVPVAACVDVALGLEGLGTGMTILNTGNAAGVAANAMAAAGNSLVKAPGASITTAKAAVACGAAGLTTVSILVPRS